jgi:hypothetical protein
MCLGNADAPRRYHLHRVAAPPCVTHKGTADEKSWSTDICASGTCESLSEPSASRHSCSAPRQHNPELHDAQKNSTISAASDSDLYHSDPRPGPLPARLYLHELLGQGGVGKCYRASALKHDICPDAAVLTVSSAGGDGVSRRQGFGHKCCCCCRRQYAVKFAVTGKAVALAGEAANYEMLQAMAGVQQSWPRYYGRFQNIEVNVIVLDYTGPEVPSLSALTVDEKWVVVIHLSLILFPPSRDYFSTISPDGR